MTADALIAARRQWVADRKSEGVEGVFKAQAIALPLPPSFHDAVRVARAERAIVVEFKRRSDTGETLHAFEVGDLVVRAEAAGACAIAIWPDEEVHGGSYQDILAAAQASPLPVLSRDPVIDPVQIVMARAHGAAAVTVDVALVSDDEMRALFRHAVELGLDVLVEASTALSLERVAGFRMGSAESSGARLVGVRGVCPDGSADLALYDKLAPAVPEFAARIATAGLEDASVLSRLEATGYDTFLVSDPLFRSEDFEGAMLRFAGEPL